MNIANEITTTGASAKRQTSWRGMTVGFNQKRTSFFQIENLGDHDSNGGHIAKVRTLDLSEIERADLLAAWRAGKIAWYQKMAGIPLRNKASRAARYAINQLN